MQFNSFEYIFLLFATVGVYYCLPLLGRKLLLLAVSFGFYMAWNAKYSLLMAAVILVTYFAARFMVKLPRFKKPALWGGLACVLGLLFYFKYFNFFISSVNGLFHTNFSALDIILPVGISFYVFQSIGYIADVYVDPSEYEGSLLNYALFISFFPQLVAGPIERSRNILKQFNTKQKFDLDNIKNGLTLVLVGLVQKVVIADRLAAYVNAVFSAYQTVSRWALITAVVFFAFQVYCDFHAYSLIATGSARTMGYTLMKNFDHPYLSRSFGEYWSRWHISLSSWFQDYIFTPFVWKDPFHRFGAAGAKAAMLTGIFLVFLVSGFWHGASWTFVVWGLLHAALRIAEVLTAKSKKRFFKKHGISANRPALVIGEVIVTFALNCVTYVFFRADTLGQAADYLRRIFCNPVSGGIWREELGVAQGEIALSFLLIALLMAWEIWGECRGRKVPGELMLQQKGVVTQSAAYACLLLALVVLGAYGTNYVQNPFVYFQF